MKRLVLNAIRFYQRRISPRKGFQCAYRAHTGHVGCSELGYRAIRRYGLWLGVPVLRKRLFLCGVAHRRYAPSPPPRPPLQQRGDCDPGCDAPLDCEPDGHSGFSVFDCCNGCDAGSCDGSGKKDKRRKNQEKSIYLPTKRRIR